jgi:hypothetical protein
MKALSLSLRPSFFGLQLFLFSSFFHFFKEVLDFFCTVPSVSSFVFASGFFFAGHFRFFFGGCTDLKDCARELVANGC